MVAGQELNFVIKNFGGVKGWKKASGSVGIKDLKEG